MKRHTITREGRLIEHYEEYEERPEKERPLARMEYRGMFQALQEVYLISTTEEG